MFRDKEDEDNPLPILHSGSCGITVTETDIDTLHCDGIAVDYDNEPAPENVMKSDDVLTAPSSLTFVFHGIYTWRQRGNFPVGRAKMKMTPNPRINHMSHLYFFRKLYFMDYIKDVVILETNKRLNSYMKLSEYFRLIGCCLIIACYVGHSVRDFFLNDPITHPKRIPHPYQTHHIWEAP